MAGCRETPRGVRAVSDAQVRKLMEEMSKRILHLAATTMETDVERALIALR